MNKYKQLIDRLADKTLSFGCRVRSQNEFWDKEAYIAQSYDAVGGKSYQLVECENKDNLVQFLTGFTQGRRSEKEITVLGHPILLGDVLESLQDKLQWLCSTGFFEGTEEDPYCIKEEYRVRKEFAKLLYLWAACGIDKSLQEIYDETEVEEIEVVKISNGNWEVQREGKTLSQHSMREDAECMAKKIAKPKDPQAEALFTLIIELLPDERKT